MSESGDYSPGEWTGYDFGSAKRTYDRHVGRSYTVAKAAGKKVADLVPKSISTESSAPLIILCDVTGSMGDWPATIFSKLPYLDLEGKEYLGDDMEISFAAVGDAFCDQYPVQVRPFKGGTDMKNELEELVIEGGGGGGASESYELTALYYSRNVDMPNADKPIMIIIGDEGFYDYIQPSHAKLAHVDLQSGEIATKEVFEDLMEKYSVYLVRKPYGSAGGHEDNKIQKRWEKLIGAQRIAILPSADRIVDVIFGILAQEKDRVAYFKDEIEERQVLEDGKTDWKKVDTVYKALKTIHSSPAATKSVKYTKGKSVFHKSIAGKKVKGLLT